MTESDFLHVVLAYLLGSVPFGLIVTRMQGFGDIRKQGSGNIGATNVTRVAGRKWGLVVLALDAIKGILAVMLAKWCLHHGYCTPVAVPLSAAFAVLGHMFPLWLRFRGGKGVATTLAVLTSVYWPLGLVTVFVWLSVFFFTRISSLSSILSMLMLPSVALYFQDDTEHGVMYLGLSFFLCVIVILKHHENINRLVQGQERKIG